MTGMISLGQPVSLGWGRERVACDGPEGHIWLHWGPGFIGWTVGRGEKGGLVTLGKKGRRRFRRLVSLGQARGRNWLDWDGFTQTAGSTGQFHWDRGETADWLHWDCEKGRARRARMGLVSCWWRTSYQTSKGFYLPREAELKGSEQKRSNYSIFQVTIKADCGRAEEPTPTGTHGSRCVAAEPDQSDGLGAFATARIQHSRAFSDFILLDAVLQQRRTDAISAGGGRSRM